MPGIGFPPVKIGMDRAGSTLFYRIYIPEHWSDNTIFTQDKKTRDHLNGGLANAGKRTGDREDNSVLTINLSRERGRYSPTKGTFIDIMPKVGIEPTIP
jgi:hypothetical protein